MRSLLLLSSVALAKAAYPSTRAFENEIFEVPAPLEAGPSFGYDDADPGGYMFYGTWTMEKFGGSVPADEMPYSPHKTFHTAWLLVVFYGFGEAPGPFNFWNCTEKGYGQYTSADFTGMLSAVKICEAGSCCPDIVGGMKFADDAMNWHTIVGDRLKGALCDISALEEEVYCHEMMGQANENCYEYYSSTETMVVNIPCVDTAVRYFLECPVFKTKLAWRWAEGSSEPLEYHSLLTPIDAVVVDSLIVYPETRLCKPHSYYHPDASSSSSGSTDGSTDSSAANYAGFLLAVLVALLM